MFGAGRASGDKTDACGDEGDADPTLKADVLVQPEMAEQRHEDITDGGGGDYVREIGKRERCHVAGHEGEEAENSQEHPGIGESGEDVGEMVNVDGADVLHAAREEGVSGGSEDYDGEQHEVFAKRQSAFPDRW